MIVPSRFHNATLRSYVPVGSSQKSAIEAAEELIGGAIRNLVLVGPTGIGKTHLAAAVVNAVVERQQEDFQERMKTVGDGMTYIEPAPIWINVADAIVAMRFEMDLPADARDVTAKVRHARTHRGLLILDDLGREKASDWTGEVIYAIVNARYEAMMPTMVTSNMTPSELGASVYWPSVSRLAEDGRLIRLSGPDHRLPT